MEKHFRLRHSGAECSLIDRIRITYFRRLISNPTAMLVTSTVRHLFYSSCFSYIIRFSIGAGKRLDSCRLSFVPMLELVKYKCCFFFSFSPQKLHAGCLIEENTTDEHYNCCRFNTFFLQGRE